MNPAQHLLATAIRLYRWVLSPAKTVLFGPLGRCRFTPSCSAYALEAVCRHGAMRGTGLAVRRLLRCHPWGGCGDDPVPSVKPPSEPDPLRHHHHCVAGEAVGRASQRLAGAARHAPV